MGAELKDKTVVVTGGTGALGGAVLAKLLDKGAICHVPTSHATAPETFAFTSHDRVKLVPNVDLTDAASVDAFYASASRPLGICPPCRRFRHVADRRGRT